ncbi:MAG TPA: choice-of-anchor I family protein [Chthoniobacteraceae bacterium]|nr:choice-of-anchor I family protein [Chthoniobacteraceae bacterium]
MKHRNLVCTAAIAATFIASAPCARSKQAGIELQPISSVRTNVTGIGAAEIVAHDPVTHRLFVVNFPASRIDVIDATNPLNPVIVGSIDITPYGGSANSVAVKDGVIAIAVEAVVRTDPGSVVFFDTNLNYLNSVPVGALPDMVTFSPNGRFVLTANEGEPSIDYSFDPEGSVSIIDISNGVAGLTEENVRTAGFAAFNNVTLDPSIRIFGPGATVAQDIEPEYISLSNDSKTAWVTLQENNAIAIIDVPSATVNKLVGLGTKDHSLTGNGLDASDRDSAINIRSWPVRGFYLPDGIASFKVGSKEYLLLANEGDAREYDGFVEEARIGAADVVLDPTAFPNAATLKANANLGRLKLTRAQGDVDHDGDFDTIYTFGGRSFSIRDTAGALVWDSGDQLERITANAFPASFNAGHDDKTFDSRSDDKGPEAESVTVGKVGGRTYAFIGLERIGGIVVFDVSNPTAPEFVQYVNNRDFTANNNTPESGDLGPEGVLFIPAEESGSGKPLVVVANEVSGTTTIFEVNSK